jgi:hypothetical protein
MPLAFESISHGPIAFGFFNIETDLLLLENHFFFASDFCREVAHLALLNRHPPKVTWKGYEISLKDIGDLHGAIAGTRLVGFIGEVYREFPFPSRPEEFKQNPEGFLTRPLIEDLIQRYGSETPVTLVAKVEKKQIEIGGYYFTYEGFHALIRYVWRGGYPRWKEQRPPHYVLQMKEAIEKSSQEFFRGLTFGD